MVKKILVPLDGSEFAEKALPYAENLTQKYDAELFLVRSLEPMLVVSHHVGREMAFYGPRLSQEKDAASKYLRSVQHRLDLSARTAVLAGRPIADAIVEIASQEAASLIVMTTHGRSGFNRWLSGSTADQVVQHATCPVVLVKVPQPENGLMWKLSKTLLLTYLLTLSPRR